MKKIPYKNEKNKNNERLVVIYPGFTRSISVIDFTHLSVTLIPGFTFQTELYYFNSVNLKKYLPYNNQVVGILALKI